MEKEKFDSYIESQNLGQIVGRYPVRETPVLNKIIEAIGFQSREKYESAVRQLLVDNDEIRNQTRNSLGELASAIQREQSQTKKILA